MATQIISVVRTTLGDKFTHGILTLQDGWSCHTLEDKVRPFGEKVFGETAIPKGKYKLVLTMSARFKEVLPLLIAVPGFEGVRIHAGNTVADTHGCLLVGATADGVGTISKSRAAMGELMNRLTPMCDEGEVWLSIS